MNMVHETNLSVTFISTVLKLLNLNTVCFQALLITGSTDGRIIIGPDDP